MARYRNAPRSTPRHEISLGALVYVSDALVQVDEAYVAEDGSLRCQGHVVARNLCAETLIHGETHPVWHWTAR